VRDVPAPPSPPSPLPSSPASPPLDDNSASSVFIQRYQEARDKDASESADALRKANDKATAHSSELTGMLSGHRRQYQCHKFVGILNKWLHLHMGSWWRAWMAFAKDMQAEAARTSFMSELDRVKVSHQQAALAAQTDSIEARIVAGVNQLSAVVMGKGKEMLAR
jgi:hypothetical protein